MNEDSNAKVNPTKLKLSSVTVAIETPATIGMIDK